MTDFALPETGSPEDLQHRWYFNLCSVCENTIMKDHGIAVSNYGRSCKCANPSPPIKVVPQEAPSLMQRIVSFVSSLWT
jgi:hypothetical protein